MDKVTPASDSERRILKRVPAELKVEYKYDSTVSQGLTGDISEGGIFLQSDKPAMVGSKIYLRLQVKNGTPPIKIIGNVRRTVEPGETGKPGMGIKFDIIYADDVTQMKNFINEYLGISVPDSGISQVAGTRSFKHVMDPGPASKTAPKPGAAAQLGSKAAAGGSTKSSAKAVARPPARRRTPEEEDRRALRKLDFSYSSWVAGRVLQIGLFAAVPVALYLTVKWILGLLDKIQ